jgi:SAM-dependent methyltransferase
MFGILYGDMCMPAWFEDDTLWESLEGFLFSQFRSPEITVREAEQILALVHPPPSAAVLDLCCGPGRHALELARRGFKVTGVDRTTRYIEAARAAARHQGLTVEFVQADMRCFRRMAAFDLALNLFSSFGYFADAEEDRQVLRHLHTSLKPGGTLLLEMAGKELLARDFHPRTWHWHAARDEYLLEERTVREGWSVIENRWIWLRGPQQKVFTWRIRLYSGAELRCLLADVGFAAVQLYGSLAGTPYDQTAQRLVAVAVR